MNFKRFDNNAKELLKEYLKGTNYCGSDFSYYAFLRWFDDLEYAEGDRALFLRAFFNGSLRYWMPLVKDGMTRRQAVEQLPEGSSLASCTEDFASDMSESYVDCTNRDWSEYIYKSSDFISLVGKRYNAKRNHIGKFKKLYGYDMRAYTKQDESDVAAFEQRWLDRQSFDSDAARKSALKESEIMFDAINASLIGETVCDVLYVNGALVGFSVGEIMPSGNAVVMYEKADIAYDGVYSFLAHEFAARNFVGCEYINRQEDMGIEGLRKSKLSYYPEFLLDKYILTPKSQLKADKDGNLLKPCVGDSSLLNSNVKDAKTTQTDNLNASNGLNVTADNSIRTLRERIKDANLNDYKIKRLQSGDFDAVMTFLKCGISHLADKKFFMNYTDDELKSVLEGGYMLGAFYEGHLVATCALDTDREFGDKLSALCKDESGRQFFEFSGIMVCPYHRNKGLANHICSKVIEYAKQTLTTAALCAVVQFDNTPSLCNLQKLGFVKRAQAKYREYDFVYLTLPIN